jgi:hypothetical protein
MNAAFACRSVMLSIDRYQLVLRNGMEEVIGSIPIRSTNNPIKMSHFQIRTSSF